MTETMTGQSESGPVRYEKLVVLGCGDAEQIVAMERRHFPCPWTTEQMVTAMEGDVVRVVGARMEGRLVAYLSYMVVQDEFEIVNLAVETEFRRKGIARRLLRAVLHSLRKEGIQWGVLEVRRSNMAAIRLYESCGFAVTGTRLRYYPDTGEDALMLRIAL